MAVLTHEYHETTHRLPAMTAPATNAMAWLATWIVIGGLMFNPMLCLLNTRYMRITDAYVMAVEMALIGVTLLASADRRAGLYLFIGVFVSYMVFLFALRGVSDAKAVRDILIPVVFVAFGSKIGDIKLADRLVTITALLALAFAMFEYFALDLYLDWFNVIGYYLAKGTVTLQETYGQTRGLFISGIRPEPRTILPFLGQHRVASVLLEPVSMGNLGVILYAWALFRNNWSGRWLIFPIALSLVSLADARFGLMTCILTTIAAPFLRFIPRPVWLVMPFIFLSLIAAYGLATGTGGGANDFLGRIQVTAHILTGLDAAIVVGAAATEAFTADSGLAYTLTKFGIFGFIGVWGAFVYLPVRDGRAYAFRAMAIIYILLLMVISNSFYSIKTGALLWFLVGTTASAAIPAAKAWPIRLMAGPSR